MPNEIKGWLKDAEGNSLAVRTTADAVKTADGSTVDAKLNAISAAVSGAAKGYVKGTIAERDAIESPNIGDVCLVKDATGDPTVEKGAAKYTWDGEAWFKTFESESIDWVVKWDDIQGKEAVEAAMAKAHEHANKAALDKLGESGSNLTFNGTALGLGIPVVEHGSGAPAGLAPGCAWFERDA